MSTFDRLIRGSRRASGFLALILVAAFAAWAWWAVDIAAVAAALLSARPAMILAVTLLILLVWFVRALRWLIVLRALGAKPRLVDTYLVTATALGFAVATPAQIGELIKLRHAHATHGIRARQGAVGFFAERVADIVVLASLTIMVGLAHLGAYSTPVAATAALLSVVLIGALVLFAMKGRFGVSSRFKEAVRSFTALAGSSGAQLGLWGSTLVAWLITAKLWQVAMASVAVEVAYPLSLLLVGLVTFAIAATFLPSGIGVSEVTVAGLLLQQGFTSEQALSAALILRVITVLAALLGVVHWLILRRCRSTA